MLLYINSFKGTIMLCLIGKKDHSNLSVSRAKSITLPWFFVQIIGPCFSCTHVRKFCLEHISKYITDICIITSVCGLAKYSAKHNYWPLVLHLKFFSVLKIYKVYLCWLAGGQ